MSERQAPRLDGTPYWDPPVQLLLQYFLVDNRARDITSIPMQLPKDKQPVRYIPCYVTRLNTGNTAYVAGLICPERNSCLSISATVSRRVMYLSPRTSAALDPSIAWPGSTYPGLPTGRRSLSSGSASRARSTAVWYRNCWPTTKRSTRASAGAASSARRCAAATSRTSA